MDSPFFFATSGPGKLIFKTYEYNQLIFRKMTNIKNNFRELGQLPQIVVVCQNGFLVFLEGCFHSGFWHFVPHLFRSVFGGVFS